MVPHAPSLRYPYKFRGTLANHVNAVGHLESRSLVGNIRSSWNLQ
jgi:hypothetical protein